jgi:hypothetical protein
LLTFLRCTEGVPNKFSAVLSSCYLEEGWRKVWDEGCTGSLQVVLLAQVGASDHVGQDSTYVSVHCLR